MSQILCGRNVLYDYFDIRIKNEAFLLLCESTHKHANHIKSLNELVLAILYVYILPLFRVDYKSESAVCISA